MIVYPACHKSPAVPDVLVPEYWYRRPIRCPCSRLHLNLRDASWGASIASLTITLMSGELAAFGSDGTVLDPVSALERFLDECRLASVLET